MAVLLVPGAVLIRALLCPDVQIGARKGEKVSTRTPGRICFLGCSAYLPVTVAFVIVHGRVNRKLRVSGESGWCKPWSLELGDCQE